MCTIGLAFAHPQFEHDTTCTSYIDFALFSKKICHRSGPISEQSMKHDTQGFQGRVAFLDLE